MTFSSDSSDGGAILLRTLSLANITRCHFKSNYAAGDGGAIYVTTQSELKIFDSEFTLNAAKNGGSIAAYTGHSFIEFSSFSSSNASRNGGCIHLKAANIIMKQNQFSGCESYLQGGSVYLVQQSALRLENVKINDSYSRLGGAIYVRTKSELFLGDSVLTSSTAEISAGIRCFYTSRVYLKSLLINSCSSTSFNGCVHSFRCNVTIDNITITDTDSAVTVTESTVNIFNSLTPNDTVDFVRAESSNVTFWNLIIYDAHIGLEQSVAEFRHTVFMTPDIHCPITDKSGSKITLKLAYIINATNINQSENRIVRKGDGTVVQGNMSGETVRLK